MPKKRGRSSFNDDFSNDTKKSKLDDTESVIVISDGENGESDIEELYEKNRGEIEEVKTVITVDNEERQFEISTVKLKYGELIYEQVKITFHISGIHIITPTFCFSIPIHQLDDITFYKNQINEANTTFSDIIQISFYLSNNSEMNESDLPHYTKFDDESLTSDKKENNNNNNNNTNNNNTTIIVNEIHSNNYSEYSSNEDLMREIFDNVKNYNANISILNQLISNINSANRELVATMHSYLNNKDLLSEVPPVGIMSVDFIEQLSSTLLSLLPSNQNALKKKIQSTNVNNQIKYIDIDDVNMQPVTNNNNTNNNNNNNNNNNIDVQNISEENNKYNKIITHNNNNNNNNHNLGDEIESAASKKTTLEFLSSSAINREIQKYVEQFELPMVFKEEKFPDNFYEVLKTLSFSKEQSFYTWLAKQNAIQLSPKDIYLLRPDKLLNDNIIDFYMKYIQEEIIPIENRSQYYFCNCFFHKMITKKDLDSVQLTKLLSPTDFFNKKYILIPVNESNHWTLMILCNVRKIVKGKAKLLCFNSLTHQSTFFSRRLRKFLNFCWQHTAHYEFCKGIKFAPNTLPLLKLKLPQQSNDTDCGLFILQYAELFCKDPQVDPNFFTEEWFDVTDIFSKRKKMYDALISLTNLPKAEAISSSPIVL